MKIKTSIIILSFLTFSIGCTRKDVNNDKKGDMSINKTHSKSTIYTENKIIDLISKLPEIKEEGLKIKKSSNGERQIIIWIYQNPTETIGKYYWVKVGEDNGDALSTHFNFYVYPENLEIKFLYTLNDSLLNLQNWRELRKKKVIGL